MSNLVRSLVEGPVSEKYASISMNLLLTPDATSVSRDSALEVVVPQRSL